MRRLKAGLFLSLLLSFCLLSAGLLSLHAHAPEEYGIASHEHDKECFSCEFFHGFGLALLAEPLSFKLPKIESLVFALESKLIGVLSWSLTDSRAPPASF